MSLQRAREILNGAGASLRDIILPGDPPADARMGSLRVVLRSDDTVDLEAWDYGMTEVLVRAHSLEAAVNAVLQRWGSTPDAVRPVSVTDYAGWRAETDDRVRSLGQVPPGSVAKTTLLPGMVVDRFGNLDGFLLHPAGQPMELRSLPPSVIDATRPQMGLTIFGVAQPIDVLGRVASPAFGQPGGGLVFKLSDTSDTVRDLLVRGDLEQLVVVEEPVSP